MKPPLPDRIRLLEDANMQLIEKINRMKAQVRHNQGLIRKYQQRMADEEQRHRDVAETLDRLQQERHEQQRRDKQAERDRQRTKERQQAEYRRQMERRLHECRVMNGLEPE